MNLYFCAYLHVHVHDCHGSQVEDRTTESWFFPPSIMWGLETELRLSDRLGDKCLYLLTVSKVLLMCQYYTVLITIL